MKSKKTTQPDPITKQHEADAVTLFQQLEQERGKSTISLGKAVKGYATRQAIFAAEPEVQVTFVRLTVATIAKIGKKKGKRIPMISGWFNDLSELEKRELEGTLSGKIRKLLPRIAKGIMARHWPEAAKDNWGVPSAADRKLAARIERLLR